MIYSHLRTDRLEQLYDLTNDPIIKREIDARKSAEGLRSPVGESRTRKSLQARSNEQLG